MWSQQGLGFKLGKNELSDLVISKVRSKDVSPVVHPSSTQRSQLLGFPHFLKVDQPVWGHRVLQSPDQELTKPPLSQPHHHETPV